MPTSAGGHDACRDKEFGEGRSHHDPKQSKSVILSFIELETRGEPNDPHRSEWRSQDLYRYPYPYPYPVARRISQHAPDPVEVLRQRSASRGLCKVLHG